MKKIYLAGGCFWGLQKYMSLIQGVKSTSVGYANGIVENPSYEEVYTGRTGHAETVEVIYDESRIGLEFLLRLYFEAINPTTLNRQGGSMERVRKIKQQETASCLFCLGSWFLVLGSWF